MKTILIPGKLYKTKHPIVVRTEQNKTLSFPRETVCMCVKNNELKTIFWGWATKNPVIEYWFLIGIRIYFYTVEDADLVKENFEII